MKNLIELVVAATVAAGVTAMGHADTEASPGAQAQEEASQSPLVERVRRATEKYLNVQVAISEGWVKGTPCVSGPDMGAMGIHYVNGERITNGVLNAEEPEALIYEPQTGGGLRLVGVEYIVIAATWAKLHPTAGPPALEGDLLNYVDSPNRYGLPAFYEMHVWAWEANPKGSFADWNTHVTCAKQAAN